MLFIISFIFTIGGAILALALSLLNNVSIGLSILISIGAYLVALAIYCCFLLVLVLTLGKHYAKSYDPLDKKRWRFMNDLSRFSCFYLGIHKHIHGLDKLPTDKPIVFYSNHQSFLDIILFDLILKDFPRSSMYKKEHEKNPLIGNLAKALGGVPIDRNNDRAAVKGVLQIIKEVNSGINFMIYPEGHRSGCPEVAEFHAGSFKVAQKADCYMALIAIDGSYRKNVHIPFIPSHVYFNVVEVTKSEDIRHVPTVELAKEAREKIVNDLQIARKKYKFLKTKSNTKETKQNEND